MVRDNMMEQPSKAHWGRERDGGGQGTGGGPMRAPTSKAVGTEALPHISDISSVASPRRCVWEHIKQASPCWCFLCSLLKNGYLFWEGSWEGSARLCALRGKGWVRTENSFHINVTRKGRMLLRWGFQRKGHALLSKTFREHRCKLKGDARHSSHSRLGRVDIRLCVQQQAGGLPHPDDSTPVFSLLPFPLLHIKPLMHVHKYITFLFICYMVNDSSWWTSNEWIKMDLYKYSLSSLPICSFHFYLLVN